MVCKLLVYSDLKGWWRLVRSRLAAPPQTSESSNPLQMNPFDSGSTIKTAGIESLPPDMIFVLRVIQLLRGMKQGEGF